MDNQQVEGRNISMYPGDWRIVEDAAQQSGIGKVSTMLRVIVREWAEMQARRDEEQIPQVLVQGE